jgi:type I restriction enzyme R subunit
MAVEYDLQQELIQYFTTNENVGGLGYKKEPANNVSNSLFLVKDLKTLITNEYNKDNYYKVLHENFKGDVNLFWDDFLMELESYIQKKKMITIPLNQERGFVFNNKEFVLYFKLGALLEEKNKNIYSIVEELNVTSIEKTITRRVDLTFFINGIPVSYCELKHNMTGQDANHGRDKVITNYKEFIKDYKENHEDDISNLEHSKNTKMFHKTIHITASDGIDTYVIRNIRDHQSRMCQFIKSGNSSDEDIRNRIKDDFKIYPSNEKDGYKKMKETFKNLYSKENLDKEITIYNYIKQEKTQSSLISPRPKQKHGVDRIIDDIKDLNKNSHIKNYSLKKFEEEIKKIDLYNNLSQSKINELVKDQNKHLSTLNFDSYVCQYSAGFGKTNIMAWIALQLKNLLSRDYIQEKEFVDSNQHLYKKIMIVTDRLDLIKQFIGTLKNMNIKSSLYSTVGEYKNGKKQTLVDLLSNDDIRICIVNVQKFNDILDGKFSDKEKEKLQSSKIAFIIDEVHRTQTGKLNDQMLDLFSSVATGFNGSIESPYRNLLIGLTATPTEAILNRYGSVSGVTADGIIQRSPFDTFTMLEAIKEGFVLDPTKHIYPLRTIIQYDDVKYNKDQNRMLSRDEIYNLNEVVDKKVKFIMDILENNSFNQIKNTASSMLVSNSIKNALKYRDSLISEGFPKEHLHIVYSISSDQKYPKLEDVNSLKPQKSIKYIDLLINNFKTTANNLIIVVDMLTTGFDAPRLHTLFLDKDISGVNAVQTLSRVNRTTKNKNNCLVIDMSIDNKNSKYTIPEAFEKYEGMTYSSLNIDEVLKNLSSLDTKLRTSNIYKNYFHIHKTTNIEQDLNLITKFKDELLIEQTSRFLETASEYCYQVNEFIGIVKGVDKYNRHDWFEFFRKLRLLIRKKGNQALKPLDFIIEEVGISSDIEDELENNFSSGNAKKYKSPSTLKDYLKMIKRENEKNFELKDKMEEFNKGIGFILDEIRQDSYLMNHINSINSGATNYEDTKADFKKKIKTIRIRNKSKIEIFSEDIFYKYTEDFGDKIFDDFIKI